MISRALARHLTARGLVHYSEAAGGDCFIEHLPDAPDEAVQLLSTGGNPVPASSTSGYDEPTVQLLVRGAPGDPVGPQLRAVTLYGALQGLRYVTLDPGGPDEAELTLCSSLQTAPAAVGADAKGRYRFSLNLALHVRALTEHRD
jgi:hypothetical protein